MNWFKKSQNQDAIQRQPNKAFEEMFVNDDFSQPQRTQTTVDPAKTQSLTLTLYRGFNLDPNKAQQSAGGIVLSPHRSEQGVMWFTHNLIRGYNPIDYVKGRGNTILVYPLPCTKHSQTVHYSDGSTYEQIPQEIIDQTEPTTNCKFHMGYELPDGWLFSYKSEKFIICTIPITVNASMLHQDSEFEND